MNSLQRIHIVTSCCASHHCQGSFTKENFCAVICKIHVPDSSFAPHNPVRAAGCLVDGIKFEICTKSLFQEVSQEKAHLFTRDVTMIVAFWCFSKRVDFMPFLMSILTFYELFSQTVAMIGAAVEIKSCKWRGKMCIRIWRGEWWAGFWCSTKVLSV